MTQAIGASTGTAPRRAVGLCFLGLVAVLLAGWLLTSFAQPAFNRVSLVARDASSVANALALVVLAVLATQRPDILSARSFCALALACLALGVPAAVYGLVAGAAVPLVAGAMFCSMGRGFATVLVCAGLVGLSGRQTCRCVAAACLVAFVVRELLLLVPPIVGLTAFFVAPFAAVALGMPVSAETLGCVFSAEAPAERAITKPSTFLPFGHQLFVSILLFRVAYGYALTIGEGAGGEPVPVGWAVVVLVAVATWAFAAKDELGYDRLFDGAALLVVAGFLTFTVSGVGGPEMANTALFAGSVCFEVMAYCMLAALARRNVENTVAVYSWGFAMYATGVTLGAQLGRAMNTRAAVDPLATAGVAAIVVFLFIAYVVVFMRGFSFAEVIGAVERTETVESPAFSVARRLDERCARVAVEHCLTPRESEVLGLLAQGRNTAYIQEAFALSRNTVKIHVHHIYIKLDVHSQQELIDLILDGA